MTATTVMAPVPAAPRRRATVAVLLLAALVALAFFLVAAAPYLVSSAYNAADYDGRRTALLVHILGGSVALFAGPLQLWLGLADRRMEVHRRLGIVYMLGVVVSASAAYVLAFVRPTAGWAFGAGLAGLATAWLATTTLAYLAIRRSLVEQHKEWTIRSYVVTFSFVTFRIAFTLLQQLGVGSPQQDAVVMAWASWSVPLLATEVILQGRKILAVRA